MTKVLVVDDSVAARSEVINLLEGNNIEIITAENGKDGLRVFQENEDINLIITDLNMPAMDGITMASEIQKIKDRKKIPIVVVSSDGHKDQKLKGKQVGVVAWVVKPIDPTSFQTGIKALLNIE